MARPMNRLMNNWVLVALVVSSSLLGADDAQARRRRPKPPVIAVTNNGVDTADCGHSSTPCRSISMGIARAKTLGWGAVSVGPGLYGDLNGNGVSAGFGEEQMPIPVTSIRVVSTHGAARTLIRAKNPGLPEGVVRVFGGGFFSGFTLQGADTAPGISIRDGSAENLVLTGHRDGAWVSLGSSLRRSVAIRNTRDGISLNDGGQLLDVQSVANGSRGFAIFGSGDFLVQGCQAIRNGGIGFLLSSLSGSSTFQQNIALANRADGFLAIGSGRVDLASNVSSGNGGSGFHLNGFAGANLSSNLTTANRGSGLLIFRSDATVDRLRAIGNLGSGLNVSAIGSLPTLVRRSAFFGNDPCQIWSDFHGVDIDVERPYLGDASRCRSNFHIPSTNQSFSENEALGVQKKKKKRRKKKRRKKASGGTPWPLQP